MGKIYFIIMQSIQGAFMQHVADFGLSYGTVEEFKFRMNQFEGINSVIEKHNKIEGVTHKLGHNFLSTWTDAEKKRLMGYRSSPLPKRKPTMQTPTNADSVNWVTKGAVFHQYTSGIISADCGLQLDHGVLAVGYGKDEVSGKEYYLVKNSWGASWGEKGYVRVGVEAGPGVCGIQMEPSYPESN